MIAAYNYRVKSGGTTAKTLTATRVAYDSIVIGRDQPVYKATDWYPHAGALESGELQVAGSGQKSTLLEVWLRTYCSSSTDRPDVILGTMLPGDTTWTYSGDTNGTIQVTNTTCLGIGTAWSNVIGAGNHVTTVFTTPFPAVGCRIYVDSTLKAAGTDYTITGASQITFVVPPPDSTAIKAYWDNRPFVQAAVGDYIESTYGYHRISSITDATHLTLSWYPKVTIATYIAGYHRRAHTLGQGEAETIFGINRACSTVRLRIVVLPRYSATSPTDIKPLNLTFVTVAGGERQLRS